MNTAFQIMAQPGQTQALGPQEESFFQSEYQNLVDAFLVEREFSAVFLRARDWLHAIAMRAKAELGEAFNGVLAQTGFGWQLIQPEHVLRLTTDGATVHIDWTRAPATVGWKDWIASAATRNVIHRDVGFVAIVGQGNYIAAPKSVATHYSIGGVSHPVWDYQWAVRTGLGVWALPEPQALGGRTSFNTRLKDIATGADEPFLFGMTFARASYLQNETPTVDAP